MYRTVIPLGNVDAITVTQVKNGQDAINLYAQVIGVLRLTDDETLKKFTLWQTAESNGGLSTSNIVKIFQQLRGYAQEAKDDALDKKILSEASWFYCNIEEPGSCGKKSPTKIKKEVENRYAPTPFYLEPVVYIPVGIALILGISFYIIRR
jgi:hypothetical protein